MTRKVNQRPMCFGLTLFAGLIFSLISNSSMGQTAAAFYASDVDSIVHGKCITCHVSGGQAGGTALRFTSSVSGNHDVFDGYVNSPTQGARASRVLSKITGGSGHGGGQQVSQGSAEYRAFSDYMDLLGADEPVNTSVLEGMNNRIKVIKRMAYGYRDSDYFFLKIKAAFPGNPR